MPMTETLYDADALQALLDHLGEALHEHAEWFRRITSAMASERAGMRGRRGDFVLSHCRLAHWLDTDRIAALRADPMVQEFTAEHRDLHALGDDVAAALAAGRPIEPMQYYRLSQCHERMRHRGDLLVTGLHALLQYRYPARELEPLHMG
ncbi:MAG: hypothetical protein AB7Q97_17065 [Gammaproteobacteria bacterium]